MRKRLSLPPFVAYVAIYSGGAGRAYTCVREKLKSQQTLSASMYNSTDLCAARRARARAIYNIRITARGGREENGQPRTQREREVSGPPCEPAICYNSIKNLKAQSAGGRRVYLAYM